MSTQEEQYYIYEISNNVTRRKYIGMTTNALMRCKQHFSHLRNGRHTAEGMTKDFIKYGEDSFQFKVIDIAMTRDEAKYKEGKYMRRFKTYIPEFGYNGYDSRFYRQKLLPKCSHTEWAKIIKSQGYEIKEVARALGLKNRVFRLKMVHPERFSQDELTELKEITSIHRYENKRFRY